MMLLRWLVLGLLAALTACGGSKELTCDEESPYLTAVGAARVQSPDDLDSLESLKEIPLPTASPREARSADAGCLDAPPVIKSE